MVQYFLSPTKRTRTNWRNEKAEEKYSNTARKCWTGKSQITMGMILSSFTTICWVWKHWNYTQGRLTTLKSYSRLLRFPSLTICGLILLSSKISFVIRTTMLKVLLAANSLYSHIITFFIVTSQSSHLLSHQRTIGEKLGANNVENVRQRNLRHPRIRYLTRQYQGIEILPEGVYFPSLAIF